MGFKVLIPQEISSVGKNYLLKKGYEIKKGSGIGIEELIKDVQDCHAIIVRTAPITEEVLRAGKQLKIVARQGSGYDTVDVKAAEELGIWATNAPLSTITSVAEHTIGLMIAVSRNFMRNDKELRKGNFEIRNQITGTEMDGKILGLIGVGKIGTAVAKKAVMGFNMKVIGYDPYVNPDHIASEIELVNDWEYIFKHSDYVSLHLPATKDTRGLIGKKEFDMMKPSAYFVNCARGEVVREEDLLKILKEEKIAGAAVDVYNCEPLTKDNPLYALNNITLTPHNASHTVECKGRMALDAAMEIERVLTGEKPLWPVNNPYFGSNSADSAV